jgi:hypothetical protein
MQQMFEIDFLPVPRQIRNGVYSTDVRYCMIIVYIIHVIPATQRPVLYEYHTTHDPLYFYHRHQARRS